MPKEYISHPDASFRASQKNFVTFVNVTQPICGPQLARMGPKSGRAVDARTRVPSANGGEASA